MSLGDAKYGIVIDAGSSGSRLHVYQFYLDAHSKNDIDKQEIELRSVPKIITNENWNYKISPGLSSFEHSTDNAYKKNIKPLLKHAETVIPKNEWSKTPIFIQATAGMRLIPEKKRNKILENVCKNLKKENKWLMESCENQIQVIDGELEGVYGWLALNYLSGNFDDYQEKAANSNDNDDTTETIVHDSLGFMDMGGASAQIAFSPLSTNEIDSHKDYMSEIVLKNLNGEYQKWDIFVSTWLGFGANQARKRYLSQLVNSLPENVNDYDDDDFHTKVLVDPCLPENAEQIFNYKNKDKFTVKGSGNYEQCSKSIYPLLLKNLPCEKEPCLFNGVHAPKIDFFQDKFVGVSEYWYTANDIFKLGGEYNFKDFSENVQQFCETDWEVILENNSKGLYNDIPDDYLLDSCFKANWILNVLHEGFNLPRIGIDPIKGNDPNMQHFEENETNKHTPFQSVSQVNGNELSWTLGKVLLYACSLIQSQSGSSSNDQLVGVSPSTIEMETLGKKFIPGSVLKYSSSSSSASSTLSKINSFGSFISNTFYIITLLFFSSIILFIGFYLYCKKTKNYETINKIHSNIYGIIDTMRYKYETWKLEFYNRIRGSESYNTVNNGNDSKTNIPYFDTGRLGELESGRMPFKSNRNDHQGEQFQMRSRSMINLTYSNNQKDDSSSQPILPSITGPKSFVSLSDFKSYK